MASNKPKKSANKKPKSDKVKESKAVAEPETVKEEVVTAPDEVETEKEAEKETKTESESKSETKDTKKVEKEEKTSDKECNKTCSKCEEKKEAEAIVSETETKPGFFKTFFSLRHDKDENILTIFHNKKIWAALLAEFFGTMILAMFFLTLGAYQPLYVFFIVLGLTGIFFSISGANLNPLITVGMMSSRRVSAIRGVLYIVSQILGAWVGYLICTAFAGASTVAATALPAMSAVDSSMFWTVTLVELMGSAIIALFYARAIATKKNPLVVSSLYAGGVAGAFIIVIIISSSWFGLNNSFALNPAIAFMYQILPNSGNNFGDLLADIGLALVTYVISPMLGGTLGFMISDTIDTFNQD